MKLRFCSLLCKDSIRSYILKYGAILGCVFVYAIFIWYYFTSTQYIPPEAYSFSNPKDLVITSSYFENFIKICFNLNIFEDGGYRPRILSFMIQTIDENLWYRASLIFPFWRTQLPLSLIIIPLIPFSVYRLLYHVVKGVPKELLFFAASTIILSEPIITEFSYRTRSSKFLVLIVISELMIFYLSKEQKSNKQLCFSAMIIAVLCTLDEAVLATSVLLCVINAIRSIKDRSARWKTLSLIAGLLLFFIWYKYIGPDIFGKYSVSIHEHGHTKALKGNLFMCIFAPYVYALQMNIFMPELCKISELMLGSIGALYILVSLRTKKMLDIIENIVVLLYPVALISVLLISHPPIYIIKGLRISLYTIPAAIVILYQLFSICSKDKVIMLMIALMILSVPVNCSNLNTYKDSLLPKNNEGSDFMTYNMTLKNNKGIIETDIVLLE